MTFDLPARWTAISEYSAVRKPIVISRPERRFDEPAGWIAIGSLGVRRETIAGIRVAIAGPEGEDVRRMDMLALLGWTLPELVTILPHDFARLTIVSAGDPMWRGGLSAPASLFIHADRPMISENATSSLLHEVMHTTMPVDSRDGYDWITEGLAEYYSIELLRRGRAITEERAAYRFRTPERLVAGGRHSVRSIVDGADYGAGCHAFPATEQRIKPKQSDGARQHWTHSCPF